MNVDFQLSNNHWKVEMFSERITRKQMQTLLLSYKDKIIFRGHVRRFKFKHVGAGIYEVSKEPLEPERKSE